MADSKPAEIIIESPPELTIEDTEIFLDMLNEKKVASFQGFGITVVFKDDSDFAFTKPDAQEEDDGHSTSNKRVEGFRRDGFKHAALYPWQNGKVLKLDGTLE